MSRTTGEPCAVETLRRKLRLCDRAAPCFEPLSLPNLYPHGELRVYCKLGFST
jgi:hypothetical protein